MATAATLTILHLAERMIFQWHETQEGLPPVTVLATARADEALQSRIERAVQLLNTLLSQRQAVHPAAGQSGPAVSADEGQSPDPLQALGHLLFHQLLPTAIQSAVNALPTAIPLTIATNTTTLPWEIAHNDRGYLALHHVVSRQLLSDRLPPVRATRAGATWSALLIGNPTANLPHTTAEIEAVATLIEAMPGAAAPRILMQRRATKATVLQELAGGHYDLIHYAGHAQVQPDPAASGLLLAKGEILTAQELQQSLAGQPFVFLNGCESARAARQPFDPVHATATSTLEQPALHGLAHAFLMGGARGLLGTHWPIHDSTSQEFAVAFYRALLQGETLDVAVQQARRALQQRRPDDPLWAAFTLYAKAGDQLRQRPARIQRPGTILAIDLSRLLADYATEHGEDVSRQIDLVHSRLASTVARFGGRLLPMPTAQLLALFPATAAQNDAARAAQAAQAVRINHLATEDKENTVGGIGISSGTLYWSTAANGDVTPSDAALAPVLGEPVQRALHLAQLHDAAILLDETAHRLLQRQTPPGALMTEPRGTTAPSAPPIFRLRALEARHRLAVAGAQPPGMDTHLPLVGRDHELTLLRTIWQKVGDSSSQRRGQGQLVGITGEAGIGKS
ncbi:MAG: CHAT domain-containing protein, partial [Caldilineaceae bacterium]|nr:CHAT domain-containing protein [Caldilineaceae bacterium]